MIKQIQLGVLMGMAILLLAFEEPAAARSVSATTGKARRSQEVSCFNYSFSTGVVTSTCDADFIVPLTTDRSGSKALTVTGRTASGPVGAVCRAVANDRFGTAFSASPFVDLPVGSAYVTRTTASVSVPSMGVFFADCITTASARLSEFDYVQ